MECRYPCPHQIILSEFSLNDQSFQDCFPILGRRCGHLRIHRVSSSYQERNQAHESENRRPPSRSRINKLVKQESANWGIGEPHIFSVSLFRRFTVPPFSWFSLFPFPGFCWAEAAGCWLTTFLIEVLLIQLV